MFVSFLWFLFVSLQGEDATKQTTKTTRLQHCTYLNQKYYTLSKKCKNCLQKIVCHRSLYTIQKGPQEQQHKFNCKRMAAIACIQFLKDAFFEWPKQRLLRTLKAIRLSKKRQPFQFPKQVNFSLSKGKDIWCPSVNWSQ